MNKNLKVRDSNIELLRILAILGVITLHYNGTQAFSLVAAGSVKEWFLLGTEALFICAVDLFVLISGYFSCTSNRPKAVKVFDLLFQVAVFGVCQYLLSAFLNRIPVTPGGLVVSLVPNTYFVTIYLTLYLLSPYVNRAVEKVDAKKFRTLLTLCFFLFSILPTALDTLALFGYPFTGLYPMSFGGSDYGYTLVQFVFMYLIGTYLRRFPFEKGIAKKRRVWLCVFFVSFFAVYFWQFLNGFEWIARSYNNPFVILMAVSVFVLFRSFSFRSRIVNLLAKGTFTVFLLHAVFLPYIGVSWAASRNVLILAGHSLLSAVGIYLVCWVVWLVYDFVTKPLRTVAGKVLAPLDSKLSLENEKDSSD